METNSDADQPTPPPTPEAALDAVPEPPLDVTAEAPSEPAPEPPVAEAEPAPETPVEPPADEPAPEPPASDATAPEASASEEPPAEDADELGRLAEAASRARLSQADEEKLTALLKEAILGGRAGVARAVEVLPKVPWIVGVRSVEQSWPDLTAGFRTQLLSGLAKDETDAARRMRLSLARALFKIEVPVALKVALGVLKDLRDKESGGLSQKDAQIVSNVFIGRGKPWLAQIPLTDLKPAEIDLLVHVAVQAVFSIPHPPVTQLSTLKWAQEAGRLDKLNEAALALATAGAARWSAKWQGALRKEVAELPEAFVAVLKPAPEAAPALEAPAAEQAPARRRSPMVDLDDEDEEDDQDRDKDKDKDEDEDEDEDEEDDEKEERPKKERPVYEPRPQKPPAESTDPRDRDRDRGEQKERPVYTPRNAGSAEAGNPRENRETREGGGRGGFNLNATLKSIEAHVQSLRTELTQAQSKLRQKEERPRRQEKVGPIIVGEPTSEELARLNLQLESRNAELQARIEELTQHSEDVAASVGAMTDLPVSDTGMQLRTLLGYKLKEDFEDFLALEQESHDLVVQQHYRTIIQHVFEVLREVQIPLEAPSEVPHQH
jgi:hypothetical protein